MLIFSADCAWEGMLKEGESKKVLIHTIGLLLGIHRKKV